MAEVSAARSGWERAMDAAERVKDRLRRAVAALEGAGVAYVVVGGNAVAEYVGRIDAGAVRTTRDVDLLIRRADLPAAKAAFESAGFVYAHVLDVDMFLDGAGARPSDAVHLLYAAEKVQPHHLTANPELDEVDLGDEFRVVSLEALVRMKLNANRDKDRTHVRDMIGVGLIDETWPARFPTVLAERLRQILATPGG